jgi:CRISPR/Cas system-associated exonuclease Cas4 (RecB family)
MLKEVIDKFYLDNQKDRDQHHFYISDAGKCPRLVFFKFKNAPKKAMEANILRIFDHGDHIHQLIMQSLLGARDIHVVSSEIKIPQQEIISGRADAIVSDGKELYVLDIKSINSLGFQYLTQAKKDNIDQIQLYLHYFEIPKGILLYVNKDNQQLKEFFIDYNQEHTEFLLKGLVNLKEQIDSNIVPSRLAGYPSDKQCRYCQFKPVCKIGESEEMKWEDLKAKIENKD